MRYIRLDRLFLSVFLALAALVMIGASYGSSGSMFAQTLATGDKHQQEPTGGQHVPADVPPGFSPIYVFSGLRDDSANGGVIAASAVHCTNLGVADVTVYVEFADYDYNPVYSGTYLLPPNGTATFTSRDTLFYSEDVIMDTTADALNQGFGRVSVNDSQPVICSAQLLDPANNPPNFMVNLEIFNP